MHIITDMRMAVILALAAAFSWTPAVAFAQASKPNILFILTDNLGYGEIGAYGGGLTRGAPTPRIDSLARDGMRFLNFNMETQCTPSRSSLMTGRWAIRSGTHSVPFGGVADGFVFDDLDDLESAGAALPSGANCQARMPSHERSPAGPIASPV